MSIENAMQHAAHGLGRKHPTRKLTADADEKRLLGDFGDGGDAGAVSIVPPSRRQRLENMGNNSVFSSGFIPRNTLKNSLSHQNGKARILKSQSFSDRAVPLDVQMSRGNNARHLLADSQLEWPEDGYVNSNSKRRKLIHEEIVDEVDSDDIDAQGTRRVGVSHRPFSIARGTKSRRDGVPRDLEESIMYAEPTWQTGCKSQSRTRHPLTNNAQGANTIDLSSDIEENGKTGSLSLETARRPASRYGAGYDNTSPIRFRDQATNGEPSPYFPIIKTPERSPPHHKSLTSAKLSWPQTLKHWLPSATPGLGTSFRDTDGRRRGHQSSSPDALAGEKNIGDIRIDVQATASWQHSPRRSRSPRKQHTSTSTHETKDNYSSECEPSIIPHTRFTSRKQQESKLAANLSRVNRAGESEVPWNVPIRAVIFKGRCKEEPGLVLVFNTVSNTYSVRQNARILSNDDPSLTLYPNKINKIFHDESELRIRFESARVGSHDNRMYIQMNNEKDARRLLHRIEDQGQSVKTQVLPPEKLRAMFDNRLSEQRTVQNYSSKRQQQEVNDIDLIMARKARQREQASSPKTQFLSNHKQRQPQGVRIVDRTQDGSIEEDLTPEHGQVGSTPGLQRTRTLEPGAYFEHKDDPLSLRSFDGSGTKGLGKLQAMRDKSASANKHLGASRSNDRTIGAHEALFGERTLRSRVRPVEPVENVTTKPDQLQEKHTKWGTKWKKPLTYPSTGPKKTTVEWDDLDRLEDDNFFNDNLIGFYLRYLEEQLRLKRPSIAKKVYFFNSFFFASLTNTSNGRRINYDAVKNWTRNVDLFGYDYIVVPINQAYHWYCAIICNLTALPRALGLEDEASSEGSNEDQLTKHGTEPGAITEPPSITLGNEDSPQVKPQHEGMADKEEETRSSLAEMSLESNNVHGEGAQARNIMGQSAQGEIDDSDLGDTLPQMDQNALDTSGAVFQPTRKGKRRSLPPKKTINPASPAIVTFDSLDLPHSPAIQSLKDYIVAEAEAKRGGMVVNRSCISGMTAKNIPTQSNMSDCGPIMLRYIEKLLEDPRDFISRTLRKELDLEHDWPEARTMGMRDNLAILIRDLHTAQTDANREEAKRKGIYINKRRNGEKSMSSPTIAKDAEEKGESRAVPEPKEQPPEEETKEGRELHTSSSTILGKEPDRITEKSHAPSAAEQRPDEAPQSPSSDHFAAASRSPSAREGFLRPMAEPGVKIANGDIKVNNQEEPLPEVEEPQQEDGAILVESKSQPDQPPKGISGDEMPYYGPSAFQAISDRKSRLDKAQQRQQQQPSTEPSPPQQEEPRIEVADSQPTAEETNDLAENFESLFDEEHNLEDVDPLQDSMYDQQQITKPMNGPLAAGFVPSQQRQEQQSVEHHKKRKASQSPIPSASPSRDIKRRDDHNGEMDQEAKQHQGSTADNQSLTKFDLERMKAGQRESPRKRGRKKKKTAAAEEMSRKPTPEIIDLDDD